MHHISIIYCDFFNCYCTVTLHNTPHYCKYFAVAIKEIVYNVEYQVFDLISKAIEARVIHRRKALKKTPAHMQDYEKKKKKTLIVRPKRRRQSRKAGSSETDQYLDLGDSQREHKCKKKISASGASLP